MHLKASLLTLALACGVVTTSHANEQMVPLATSGNWAALAHRPSMTAPVDVCVATSVPTEDSARLLAFRADVAGVELRVMDPTWSLPADVQGEVSISVNGWNKAFEVSSNTANLVAVKLPEEDLLSLFSAMDKATQISIKVGTAKPFSISLVGSTRSTDAFRTCAGIKSNSGTPGSNPFN